MKRVAYICSVVLVVVFLVAGIAPYVFAGIPSGGALVPAIVYAAALAALHFDRYRWIRTLAIGANGFLALVVVLLVVFGVDSASGARTLLAGASLAVLLAAPAALNVVVLLRRGRKSGVVAAS